MLNEKAVLNKNDMQRSSNLFVVGHDTQKRIITADNIFEFKATFGWNIHLEMGGSANFFATLPLD